MSNNKKLIRENFRNAVFKRDGYKCVFCNITENLDAHHITDRSLMPNGGYVVENGISLCEIHHIEAEEYHQTNGHFYPYGMAPEDLYKIINSSYDKAVEESNKLVS